jgi:protein-glutamine gamma-glutamyltransferase
MQVQQFYLLLLMLFPLMSHEFLPWSFILTLIGFLGIRIFFKIPTILVYFFATILIYLLVQHFGLVVIPETTVSFLAIMCGMKIIMSHQDNYHTKRFLGFLWASSFVLFRTDLLSLLLLLLFSFFNITYFNQDDNVRIKLTNLWSLKKIGSKEFIFVVLGVLILFFIFPRQSNFLPSSRSQPKGMIGYSKEINNSEIESLEMTSQTAFIAQMPEIAQDKLYWRGRVHTITDGHNWKSKQIFSRGKNRKTNEIDISYQIKYEQDFEGDIILLDTPVTISSSNLSFYQEAEFSTFKTYQNKKKFYLSAASSFKENIEELNALAQQKYLQLPPYLTPALSPLLSFLKPANNLSELLTLFKEFLNKEGFVYGLEAKGATSLKGFLENKIGFCTHYASLLGIVLRHYQYPARLVSGFQGGLYNSSGEHYKVTSNDAHAWVEVYYDKKWQRIDPTSYVAMERVMRGGENYYTGTPLPSEIQKRVFISRLYFQTMAVWETINYKVSLWLDTFDREEQASWAKFFKISWPIFILIGLTLFSFIIWFFIRFFAVTQSFSTKLVDQLFMKFVKMAKKQGVEIFPQDNLAVIRAKIAKQNLPSQQLFYNFLDSYALNKYAKETDEQQLIDHYKKLRAYLRLRYWPIR